MSEAVHAPDELRDLATELAGVVEGDVGFDAGSRALYATAGSNYRQLPLGVVVPRTVSDVEAAMGLCRRYDVPVLGRGGGTSLAGQSCNVAVVFDFSRHLNRVLDIDADRRTARVEPGVTLDTLRVQARAHGLTFGPDPSTHEYCTLGGMIGNNSCGVHSVSTGRTADNVIALDVLTYDGHRFEVGATTDEDLAAILRAGGRRGDIYQALLRLRDEYGDLIRRRYPRLPRRVSGYNLDELLPEHGLQVARALVGTEGTATMTLEATVGLVDLPPHRALAVIGYRDVFAAADDIPRVLEAGPVGLEGMDAVLVEDMRRKGLPRQVGLLPEGRGWLLAEFAADDEGGARAAAEAFLHDTDKQADTIDARLFCDPAHQEAMWRIRESGLGATSRVPGEPDTWEGWEDSAVAPDRLGEYLRELKGLYDQYGYKGALYGHFGDGCVHTRINFDLITPRGIRTFRRFIEEASDLVVGMGGSLSGEHGDGQSRAEFLPKMFGNELIEAFGRFKAAWDPDGKMNPGKVVDPYRIDENLRLGPGYEPPAQRTFFRFPDDDGSFARATERCVGVGKCRRLGDSGGIMCPSYMVTREEEHSTRGRAHLLFEMLSGRGPIGGWRDEHVKDALDLCLACKGCKGECPVNVDLATYKAEFLAHYYRGRLRPPSAYTMGLIMYGARVAQHAPRLANAITRAPGLSSLVKRAAGIAPQRDLPRFSTESFSEWWRTRRPSGTGEERPEVVLWPDTFTEHFSPEIGRDAVAVLEAAGYRVRLPDGWLCCGRPLYDFGFLRHARRLLERTLRVLGPDIEAGTPIVVLEPSCATVLRDELLNLLPHRNDATRLASQTLVLSEFLDQHAADLDLGSLDAPAIVQPHCHHKAVLGFEAQLRTLNRLGVDAADFEPGCCGMAGAFGFEAEHYDVSVACGERAILPAVRDAAPEALILADGFSCREQISQGTGRRPLHLAEVARRALDRTPSSHHAGSKRPATYREQT